MGFALQWLTFICLGVSQLCMIDLHMEGLTLYKLRQFSEELLSDITDQCYILCRRPTFGAFVLADVHSEHQYEES